ncbi:MAG: hypothetical protein ABSE51_03210 [Terracidiphilus sp.]
MGGCLPGGIDIRQGTVAYIGIPVHALRIGDVIASIVGIGREPAALGILILAEEGMVGIALRVVIESGVVVGISIEAGRRLAVAKG